MLKQGDTGFSRRAIDKSAYIHIYIHVYIHMHICVCNNRKNTLEHTMGSYNSYSWHSYVNKEVSVLFDSPPFPAGFRAIKGQLKLNNIVTRLSRNNDDLVDLIFFFSPLSLEFRARHRDRGPAPTAVSLSFYIRKKHIYIYKMIF